MTLIANIGFTTPFFSGDTLDINIPVTSPDGTVYDLSGVATVGWELREGKVGSPVGSALVSKSLDDGIVITDAPGGIMVVHLDPSDTDDLYGVYMYECQITLTGGAVHTIVTGAFKIWKDSVE